MKYDGLVKSQKSVTPAKAGVHNLIESRDSRFSTLHSKAIAEDGRGNDEKGVKRTFYESVKYRFPFFFILISFLLYLNACNWFGGYSQSYVIIINRSIVGKEIVNEKTNIKGDLVCLSEQERDTFGSKKKDRRIIRTKMVFQQGKPFPVSYSYDSGARTSYEVKVKDGQIIRTHEVEGETQETITHLNPDMLMFDLNAFHTIAYWISNYDTDKGGPQVFQTYVMPAGSIERLSVIPAGIKIPQHENKRLQLRSYMIEITDDLTILLWVDKDNRLYRMFVRGPNVEVIRSDLFEQINETKKSRNKRS
jgi:hypothetical protein